MRTIIIDDEFEIREGLKILLKNTQTTIIGEASNVNEAIVLIEKLKPELLLLDIQLHNKTGFKLLDELNYLDFKLVFITAYNEYAIKAFKYNALDYLLKPIDPQELEDTIARISKEKGVGKPHINLAKENTNLDKVIIKTTENIFYIPLVDIVRCEADQGYTHFYLKDKQHILSSKTLKDYNRIFPENQFVRVHQSHLLNWDYISHYDKKGFLVLKNNESIPVSVRKRKNIMALFKH